MLLSLVQIINTLNKSFCPELHVNIKDLVRLTGYGNGQSTVTHTQSTPIHTDTQLYVGTSMKTQITHLEPTSSRTSSQSRNP